jgi:hypothetical protein
MAASTLTTTTFANDTDAHFRTWVAAFIAAIVAGGWVQTADTGQINTGTVLAPLVVSTSQGYAIFRSNDSGGGLSEFYCKMEFGSGAVSATRPAVWITFGFQGTDGAGNLLSSINPISTRTANTITSNPAGASQNINFSSGSGYFCICVTGSTVAESLLISVERTKNASLAFMNQLHIWGNGTVGQVLNTSAGGIYSQVINTLNAFPIVTTAIANSTTVANNLTIAPTANSPIGGIVALGLVFGMGVGNVSPSLNMFGVEDLALGAYQDVVSVTVLGVAHNYKLQRTGNSFGNVGSTVIMTRYE